MLRQMGRREDGRTARDAPRPRWSERGTERPRSPAERSARLPPAGWQRPPRRRPLIGRRGGGRGAHWPAARRGGGRRGGARSAATAGARPPPAARPGPALPCPPRSTRARPGPPAGSAARQGLTGSVPRSSAGPDQPPGATVGVMAREREGCASPLSHTAIKRGL